MIGQQAIQGFSENGYVGVYGLNLFVKRADEAARIAHRPHQNILMPAVGRKRQEDVTSSVLLSHTRWTSRVTPITRAENEAGKRSS